MKTWVLVIVLYTTNNAGLPDRDSHEIAGFTEEKCLEQLVTVASQSAMATGHAYCYDGSVGKGVLAGFKQLPFFRRN